MIHYAGRCGENNISELTRWQKLHNPFLEVIDFDVVARADDAGFVDSRSQCQRWGAEFETT